MDFAILTFLVQDGLTTGAIYALIALAIVLVFAVTRVILVCQGDFVVFSALTLATLQAGQVPGTLWLLIGGALLACAKESALALRHSHAARVPLLLLKHLSLPAVLWLLLANLDLAALHGLAKVALTLAIVVPLGPILYRLVYQPVAETSVLLLLILSVALHITLIGLGLWLFGAEDYRTLPFTDASFLVGDAMVGGQNLLVIGIALALIIALYLFFGFSLYGKALRATAFNRNGAQLMGIPTDLAGSSAFFLAAAIGACSGILIGPITTLYYDSGFLISLKGFVAAIIGGLLSYPLAALGAFAVGLIESFASFWASAYKEVIVFTLVIPVLLWLSLTTHHVEEEH
ncbi:MAG: branched-chain amino acid ABC transporter permease [Pseudomonas sp.]|nr:branched-chain amino acid ABC transporter permease [Pseudomonas sp.]MBA4243663.1 branched-chain amino acid ABC transporter permease [Pseudomonas sp.]